MDPAKAKAEGRTIRLSSQMVDLANPGQLLPTPMTSDTHGSSPADLNRKSPQLRAIDQLLPTPNTMDGLPAREGEAMERQLRRGEGENASRRTTMGNLREDILQTVDPDVFKRELLPTPKAADGIMATPSTSGRPVEKSTHLGTIAMLQPGHLEHRRDEPKLPTTRATDAPNWGQYEPAIRRWEAINGSAPAPTEPNTKGKHRLSARFAEWMMGLQPGWVTGETADQHRARLQQRLERRDPRPVGMRGSLARWDPGIKRNDQLKAIGNGVVPQQAIMALTAMKMATQAGGH